MLDTSDQENKMKHYKPMNFSFTSRINNFVVNLSYTLELSLLEFTQNHPQLLGDKITKNYASTLPFLMKVLSIGHPLQLQIHPTKVTTIFMS